MRPLPSTIKERQKPDRRSCCNANIAKQNRFSFAGTNKIQRSGFGAGSSLQNLVLQRPGAERAGSGKNPIFFHHQLIVGNLTVENIISFLEY